MCLYKNATITAVTIPRKYSPEIISQLYFGKNACAKNAYIGSFAEQLMNGVSSIVILLSLSLGRVLVDITAGTVQPKPISIGTMLRPERPIFLNSLSMKNATLARYPLSSSIDKNKNSTTMTGRKLNTLPSPAKIPLVIRLVSIGLTLILSIRLPTSCDKSSMPFSISSCRNAPMTPNVSQNIITMISANIGIAVNLPVRILSILALRMCSLLSLGLITVCSLTFLINA